MLAHLPHPLRKVPYRLEGRSVLKVMHYLVAVTDCLGVVQRNVEERLEVVFVSPGGHCRQDLIEIQVREEGRLFAPTGAASVFGPVKENAVENTHAASTASDPVEAISRFGASSGLHR
jgi:hypothetical protein